MDHWNIYTEWSKSHATHKSVTRENFTIMLMVILILYVGTTVSPHSPQVLARPWLHPVHSQSSENVIFDKMFFFFARSTCFILEHYFSTRSYAQCQNAFRNSFPDSVVPNKSTIQRLVEREYWWQTSFCSKFRWYQGTFTSVSNKIV
jgi:hypothetical protein